MYHDLVMLLSPIVTTAICGYAVWAMQHNQEQRKKQSDESEAIQQALVALLRQYLVDGHRRHMKRETISTADRISYLEMYEAYTRLGGNGIVPHLVEDVDGLKLDNA